MIKILQHIPHNVYNINLHHVFNHLFVLRTWCISLVDQAVTDRMAENRQRREESQRKRQQPGAPSGIPNSEPVPVGPMGSHVLVMVSMVASSGCNSDHGGNWCGPLDDKKCVE